MRKMQVQSLADLVKLAQRLGVLQRRILPPLRGCGRRVRVFDGERVQASDRVGETRRHYWNRRRLGGIA
jgi:hypothetical protein